MIKKCKCCNSNDLEHEESLAFVTRKVNGLDKDVSVPAISYLCHDCGAEFIGTHGGGIHWVWNPIRNELKESRKEREERLEWG